MFQPSLTLSTKHAEPAAEERERLGRRDDEPGDVLDHLGLVPAAQALAGGLEDGVVEDGADRRRGVDWVLEQALTQAAAGVGDAQIRLAHVHALASEELLVRPLEGHRDSASVSVFAVAPAWCWA